MKNSSRKELALSGVTLLFCLLAAAFVLDLWGRPAPLATIPLVDTNFLSTATIRQSYADLVKAEEDISGFDCYACHDKKKELPVKHDENGKIIIPKEHENIVMMHGRHERNNHCYNCHNETDLLLLQPRDGRQLKFAESTGLCGSCHGPTFRDWEAGVHGRKNGYWNEKLGAMQKQQCVNCHDPHAPKIPGRKPAPGPHSLHEKGAPPHPGPLPHPNGGEGEGGGAAEGEADNSEAKKEVE